MEFFPHNCSLPQYSLQDQLEEKLSDQVDILQEKKNTNQLPPSVCLDKFHKLLTQYSRTAPRVGTTGTPKKRTDKHKKGRAVTPPRVGRQTRSNKTHDIGTLIRKRFPNRKHYEGEVTNYDPTNRLYRIKYLDGDTEDFAPEEVKQHFHHTQRHTQKAEANAAGGTLCDPEFNKMCHYILHWHALRL